MTKDNYPIVYNMQFDSEIREKVRVLDPTAKSFGSLSIDDIRKCVSKGVIPQEIAGAFLKNIERELDFHRALNSIEEKGKELNPEQLLKAYKENAQIESMEELKRKMQINADFINFLVKNKNKILTILNDKESNTFRVSRGIADNKFPKRYPKQSEFFNPNEWAAIEQGQYFDSTIRYSYLNLSEAEDRVLIVLCQLLAKNSEKYDQSSPSYYMGNAGKGHITIDNIEMETARMIITPHEFYKTYLGRDNYGSNNSKHIWTSLIALAKKQFLISFSIQISTHKKDSQKRVKTFSTFLPLFKLGIINPDQTEKEAAEFSHSQEILEGRKCQLIFKFSPIFTNAIRERYVEYPENIHLRIAQVSSANKGRKVHQSVNLMRDLIFREKQQKRYKIERDESTLVRDLGLEKEVKSGRRKRTQERLEKALTIFLKIGLLEKVEKTKGAKEQVKYVLHINKIFK